MYMLFTKLCFRWLFYFDIALQTISNLNNIIAFDGPLFKFIILVVTNYITENAVVIHSDLVYF